MARPSATGQMTIAQLENLLQTRRRKLAELERERRKAQTKLDGIDRQISTLAGRMGASGGANGSGGTGGRARNEFSLVESMSKVLRDAGKPMGVGDIAAGVLKSGYKSNSANFRAIVNQTLIKERKNFNATERGVYALKK
jgi:hypothetical protein